MREMGHASMDMINEVYGHLGDIDKRQRKEVVEYRIEEFPELLRDRLSAIPIRLKQLDEVRAENRKGRTKRMM